MLSIVKETACRNCCIWPCCSEWGDLPDTLFLTARGGCCADARTFECVRQPDDPAWPGARVWLSDWDAEWNWCDLSWGAGLPWFHGGWRGIVRCDPWGPLRPGDLYYGGSSPNDYNGRGPYSIWSLGVLWNRLSTAHALSCIPGSASNSFELVSCKPFHLRTNGFHGVTPYCPCWGGGTYHYSHPEAPFGPAAGGGMHLEATE